MQINQCAYAINVTTLKSLENENLDHIDHVIHAWLEDHNDRFIVSINIDRQLNPGFGFVTFATIVHRQATREELGYV